MNLEYSAPQPQGSLFSQSNSGVQQAQQNAQNFSFFNAQPQSHNFSQQQISFFGGNSSMFNSVQPKRPFMSHASQQPGLGLHNSTPLGNPFHPPQFAESTVMGQSKFGQSMMEAEHEQVEEMDEDRPSLHLSDDEDDEYKEEEEMDEDDEAEMDNLVPDEKVDLSTINLEHYLQARKHL